VHLSTDVLQQFLQAWGYLAVFLFVAIESTGIPFPGETMLVLAAVYAGTGRLSIVLVIASAAAAAIVGDNVGYLAGKYGGRPLLLRVARPLHLDAAKLDSAERFFVHHGDKTVFLGRFVAVLRTWAAFLAGLNRMAWHRFLFFNAAGGICWSILYGTLAFELGKNLPLLHRVVTDLGLAGIAVAVVAAIVIVILWLRARRALRVLESRIDDHPNGDSYTERPPLEGVQMSEKRVAPYGSWISPITSELIVTDSVTLGQITLQGDDTYWLEGRPLEKGRSVVVHRAPDGTTHDVTPAPYNVRTRVHEYGGGAYAVSNGTVYFSNFGDNRLYRQTAGTEPQPLTADNSALRYADFVVDSERSRLICVRQDHTTAEIQADNTIVAIDIASGEQTVLVSGADFYSSPRLSPDGRTLVWLTWNHPNMPWNGTELRRAAIQADGSVGDAVTIAGGIDESIFAPRWSPDGLLYFTSDKTGWWNLYRYRDGTIEPILPMEAEFGAPHWVFGMSTYDFSGPRQIVAVFTSNGREDLIVLNLESGEFERPEPPYNVISDVRAVDGRAVFIGASPTTQPAVVQLNIGDGTSTELRRSAPDLVSTEYISIPEAIEFPTENGLTAHALYYAPRNPDFAAPEGTRPPLIVHVHGGPTGRAMATLNLRTQFWTSRGFAFVDVNYGGSAGYGREYRDRLNGAWGILDVQDAINAARYLIDRGLANPDQVIITGGSAGGYTTLQALTTSDFFALGSSHFGLSDLVPFAQDTHKFESRYLDKLVAPYPEGEAVYVERSPITHADRLSAPTIIFQGLDDKVVPPSQAEFIVDVLREQGIPFAYIAFEGEGHGFRQAENITRALDAELYFFTTIFGIELPEPVPGIEIENLGSLQRV